MKYSYTALILSVNFFLLSCSSIQTQTLNKQREVGTIISVESIDSVTKQESNAMKKNVRNIIKFWLPKLESSLANLENAEFDYDVKFQKVTYTTQDPLGKDKVATALVVSPVLEGKDFQEKPLISFQHPTGFQPSKFKKFRIGLTNNPSLSSVIAWLFASKGYTVLATDQIDYGLKSEVYLNLASGDAVMDLIQAVRRYKHQSAWKFNEENKLIGYSQGGFDSLAANITAQKRKIEINETYAASGSYDLFKTFERTLLINAGKIKNPIIDVKEQFVFLVRALNSYINYYPELGKIEDYVQGKEFTKSFISDFLAGKSLLGKLLKKNNILPSFKKRNSKVLLFYAEKDQVVPSFNTENFPDNLVSSKVKCLISPKIQEKKLGGVHQNCLLLFVDYVYKDLIGNSFHSKKVMENFRYQQIK